MPTRSAVHIPIPTVLITVIPDNINILRNTINRTTDSQTLRDRTSHLHTLTIAAIIRSRRPLLVHRRLSPRFSSSFHSLIRSPTIRVTCITILLEAPLVARRSLNRRCRAFTGTTTVATSDITVSPKGTILSQALVHFSLSYVSRKRKTTTFPFFLFLSARHRASRLACQLLSAVLFSQCT